MQTVRLSISQENGMADVYLDGNIIKRGIVEILNIKDIKIPGMHNVEELYDCFAAVSGLVSKGSYSERCKNFRRCGTQN